MNLYHIDKTYNYIWNIKYVYDLYYYPYTTLINAKNVYYVSSFFYPYVKDTVIRKVISNHYKKNIKEDIKLTEL